MTEPTPHRRKKASYRGAARLREHHQTHAQGQADEAPPILSLPGVATNIPAVEDVITTQAALEALLERMRPCEAIAFDSEFIGETSYHPKLCVIQLATPDEVALVDPLAGLDLKGLWELLVSPSPVTIVHAGGQDLTHAARHTGQSVRGVFDTQIAAGFVGLTYPLGLARLASDLLGADMGRGLKFSQWDHRPLSSIQLWYAANDVRYLIPLRVELMRRLSATDHQPWHAAATDEAYDHALLTAVRRSRTQRGKERMTPQQAAIMERLLVWRESIAEAANLPPRTVVDDGVLTALAKLPLHREEDLASVRGLPRPVRREHGQTIMQLIEAGRNEPTSGPMPLTRAQREAAQPLADDLTLRIRAFLEARGIDPTLVTNVREVHRFICRTHLKLDHEPTRLESGWRAALLADVLSPAQP